jgi:hypothetical protein
MGKNLFKEFNTNTQKELVHIDIEKEYKLIKQKQSNLSARLRNVVVYVKEVLIPASQEPKE